MATVIVTLTLTTSEVAAIRARAEVERVSGEYGEWSKIWEQVKAQMPETHFGGIIVEIG